ncbi:MAG: CoB--CoM heterodisulfide reductase iron-sulfur subunit A family protein [Deltaproteobacteria bacterium]|nr:CoB--CoM heterodisulfide reductase iron-sulfur subunit A family protein [Deltaproteobacteria bacterium]
MSEEKPRGPVIIIGGGIAGIQAALSLSGAGHGVYLVERAASLGGMLPSLHRIYPLCVCCKLDPRIAACDQDPNIEVLLDTQLVELSGKIGDFKATLETGGEKKQVEVGAVILAAGIEAFDPTGQKTYPYGLNPNVVTSVEYEQLQKPLGPNGGILKRPSDGKKPEKVAWLQCVGSRDINQCDAPYCSSVCCMYALKEAVNTKEFDEDIETTIFYIDMRTHGKGFEDYLNNAIEKDVRLIRSRVHTVDNETGSDNLMISYADEKGEGHSETFDMVVLSVGLKPSSQTEQIANMMGLNLTPDQFIGTEPFKPVSTNVPGIFVCGGATGPNDISQSVIQAAASAAEVAAVIDPEPFSSPQEYPEPVADDGQVPAILFAYQLCPDMASDIGEQIDAYASKAPGVTTTFRVNGDIRMTLSAKIKAVGANRLVFASCTPVIHENLLQEVLKLAGLNPYLYEMVDLRNMDESTPNTQLQDRIRMGVARAGFLTAPALQQVPVTKSALVVGGGISGIESALALSREGYPVTLVEKEPALGGNGRHIRKTWQGYDVQVYLKALVEAATQDENITVMTETTVKTNRGFGGSFVATVNQKGSEKDISCGAVILAPGGTARKPEAYLYGRHKNVLLWSELDQKLIEDPVSLEKTDTAVFIQCVGSRGDLGCAHCSNVCCSFSVRAAIDMKAKNPDMNIYILYRDMRTFGERELIYREAREKGVIFIRYELENKPDVQAAGDKLNVVVYDQVLQRSILLEADLVSLQTAILGTNNAELADIFGVDLDENGFFAESPEKLRPVDATREGIFIAGMAAYPKGVSESIAQGKAASARALELLCRDTVQVGGMVAEVNTEKCAVCCTCVRTCPFDIPVIDREIGAAYIDPALCQGCGMCVAECPGKAIYMISCSDQMLIEAPSVLLATQ